MLFSDRSVLTMLHGLVLSGGALMTLVMAVFILFTASDAARGGRSVALLTTAGAVLLWLSVIVGTYVVFPLYRATPPEGIASLVDYPRALIMADPDKKWLHSFGMEIKEHMPWIAAMLATAAAYIALSFSDTMSGDSALRRLVSSLLAISIAIVAFVALLGVFINKVAPVW
jgi:hypothetical protein